MSCAGDQPGPGEYHAPPLPAGPAYTIPAAALEDTRPAPAAPGPGEYVGIDAGAGALGPAYTMPQAGAAPAAATLEVTPGPGDYGPPCAAAATEGPAFTIAARWACMQLCVHVHAVILAHQVAMHRLNCMCLIANVPRSSRGTVAVMWIAAPSANMTGGTVAQAGF